MFAPSGGPHSQFPAEWNCTTAGLAKLGFAVLMGETPPMKRLRKISGVDSPDTKYIKRKNKVKKTDESPATHL